MSTDSKSCCYCDDSVYRKCVHCQAIEDREQEQAVCESWNWNCSPRECAKDAKDRGWSLQKLKYAMRAFGYRPDDVAKVVFEFESESE